MNVLFLFSSFLSFFLSFLLFFLSPLPKHLQSISSFLQCNKQKPFFHFSVSLYYSFPSQGLYVFSSILHMRAISSFPPSFFFFFLVLLEFLYISETTHAVFKMWKTGSYHTLQWFLSFQSIRLLIKQTMKVCNLLLPHLSRSNCYRCSWDLVFLEGILDIE